MFLNETKWCFKQKQIDLEDLYHMIICYSTFNKSYVNMRGRNWVAGKKIHWMHYDYEIIRIRKKGVWSVRNKYCLKTNNFSKNINHIKLFTVIQVPFIKLNKNTLIYNKQDYDKKRNISYIWMTLWYDKF